jgi:hypothetical protein
MAKADAKAAIAAAKREIQEEDQKKAVKLLKDKYRERSAAQTIVDNIDREIEDLELKIEHGNY